jgi:hypothetical protein
VKHYHEPLVRPARVRDARRLAPLLGDAERDEILAATGRSPAEELLRAVSYRPPRSKVYAIEHETNVLGLFGVTPSTADTRIGNPWLLRSNELLLAHRKIFVRQTPKWISDLSQGFQTLEVLVYWKNASHMEWLKRAGFVFNDVLTHHGFGRESFWRFRKDVSLAYGVRNEHESTMLEAVRSISRVK